MASFDQAIARSKLEYMEKYGFGKLADIDMIKRQLNYQIDFSEDRKKAVIHTPTGLVTVNVKIE